MKWHPTNRTLLLHHTDNLTNNMYQSADIDDDEVHIMDAGTFLEFNDLKDFRSGDFIFSFRSLQKAALLLYWQDAFNNFLQVELRGQGDVMTVVYNSGSDIVEMNITVPGRWFLAPAGFEFNSFVSSIVV